ncbi:MAG: hypothetical protein D6160_06625 [Ketobacter sp.]|nr:MAG: hypothetical protein D6160_06625 [Ketobacter sp.]
MVPNRKKINGNVVPKLMFAFALIFFSVLYGMVAANNRLFPYYTLIEAGAAITRLMPENKSLLWYFIKTEQDQAVTVQDEEMMAPGLTKVVAVEGDHSLSVKVVNAQGDPAQRWRIEWNNVWPEAPDYLDWAEVPKARPGTHIHGAEIADNGDLIFNFEHLGLVRMDVCGNVVWKLRYRTHHSVFIDEQSNIWVSAQINHKNAIEKLPLYRPRFIEPMILKVSPQGEILMEKSVFDLLIENNLEGALYVQASDNQFPISGGDTLHLNDVEVFPASLQEGFFKAGDIMISLRNANTIAVFDRHWKLKYSVANEFVRQHDPDFIDGNTISIFDNHNMSTPGHEPVPASRILLKTVPDGALNVAYSGTQKQPFFTNIMGKHQWLENGNLLISESRFGRALEVTSAGTKVWELYNIVEPGWLGIIEEVERLPASYDAEFFAQARQRCEPHQQAVN